MANRNYRSGRRNEYLLKKELESEGYTVLRTAGSHGFADLIAVKDPDKRVRFIQIKSIKSGNPDNMLDKFLLDPPLELGNTYDQELWIRFKGKWHVISV